MKWWLDVLDFGARAAFFVIPPFFVFVVAAVFPVGATVLNLAFCVLVVVFANVLRSAGKRVPLLGKALGGALKFEQYYRLHPPKPFVYYMFYPLLFPYWLAVESARREFLL